MRDAKGIEVHHWYRNGSDLSSRRTSGGCSGFGACYCEKIDERLKGNQDSEHEGGSGDKWDGCLSPGRKTDALVEIKILSPALATGLPPSHSFPGGVILNTRGGDKRICSLSV